MPFKALSAHIARTPSPKRRHKALPFAYAAAVSMCLLVSNEAMAYHCSFENANKTILLSTPSTVELMPGAIGPTGTTITDSYSGPTSYANCDQGAASAGGIYRAIPLYLYFDSYYSYVDSSTVRLGSSNFGLKIYDSSGSGRIKNGPLRLDIGIMLFNIGASNPAMETHGAVSFHYRPVIKMELVRLSTGLPEGGAVQLASSSLILGNVQVGTGADAEGRNLTSNIWGTLKWSLQDIPVTQAGCKANSPTVQLGTHTLAGTGVGTATPPIGFSISLTECPTNMAIYYQIDPATDIVPPQGGGQSSSLMKLDSTSGASGVGVQLLYENGQNHPLATKITLTSTGLATPNTDIMLKARYMQIAPTVTPGTANASATVTITYQ